jgi:hypothetical protein
MVIQLLFWSSYLIPATTGHRPTEQSGAPGAWVGNGIFFAVAWNRMRRRWWVGALIGAVVGLAAIFVGGFIAGVVAHRPA